MLPNQRILQRISFTPSDRNHQTGFMHDSM